MLTCQGHNSPALGIQKPTQFSKCHISNATFYNLLLFYCVQFHQCIVPCVSVQFNGVSQTTALWHLHRQPPTRKQEYLRLWGNTFRKLYSNEDCHRNTQHYLKLSSFIHSPFGGWGVKLFRLLSALLLESTIFFFFAFRILFMIIVRQIIIVVIISRAQFYESIFHALLLWFKVRTCNAGLVNRLKSFHVVVDVGFWLHDGFNNNILWILLNDVKSIKKTFTSQLTQVCDQTLNTKVFNYFWSSSVIVIPILLYWMHFIWLKNGAEASGSG